MPTHKLLHQSPLIKPMVPRSPHETHRASTPLELLFDLVFVVAIALASAHLHHGIAENHIGHAVLSYFMVFFAIWWAWMNFSWFASAYDVDDVPYRLLVMVQLSGALILAAGVPRGFDQGDFKVVCLGYVIMRFALIIQWLRAWRADPERRKVTARYIVGLVLVQAGWITLVLSSDSELRFMLFFVLMGAELAVPMLAEKGNPLPPPFHFEHIVERYGLFTIIVLGESITAASMAMQGALNAEQLNAGVLKVGLGGVLIVLGTSKNPPPILAVKLTPTDHLHRSSHEAP